MTGSVQTQFRRGTATQLTSFTPAAGEMVVDTTNNRVVVGDGSTVGGWPAARAIDLPLGVIKNLIAGNAAGPQSFSAPSAPNTQQKITATLASLFNATLGTSVILSSVSVTPDTANSNGANGLDTGSLAASTWYARHIIYNPGSATTAGLFSLSATAPTLPSGYTYSAFAGWCITDASKNWLRVLQQGKRAHYVVGTNPATSPIIANGTAGTESDTSPTLTTVSVAGVVPTTASRILIAGVAQWKGNGSNSILMVAPNTGWGGTNNGPFGSNGNVFSFFIRLVSNTQSPAYCEIELEGTTIAWCSSAAGGAISCIGWDDNMLN